MCYNPCMAKRLLAFGYSIPILMLIGIIALLTVNVPYWDDYGAIIGYFAHPLPERLLHLADFNNEHRILTARLTFETIYQVLGRFDFQVCMGVGAAFLLGFAALLASVFWRASPRGKILFLPCFWLVVSFIHYENLCWAMCAVSNIPVHFWALLACLALSRQTKAGLFTSFGCATLATFSTGGGMAIWPCLILFSLFQRHDRQTRSLCQIASLCLCASISIALYFIGFPTAAEPASQPFAPTTRILHTVLFFISFVGGWIPSFWPALAIGIITLVAFGYFTFNLPRIKTPSIYFFLLYLLGNMAAAALFRSADYKSAISFRYILIPISALTCTTLLAGETFLQNLKGKAFYALWATFLAGSILYSTAFLVLGGPLFAKRNEIMRHNILCWPKDVHGLRCPPEFYAENDNNLKIVIDAKIYDPSIVRRPNETLPSEPIPWLK